MANILEVQGKLKDGVVKRERDIFMNDKERQFFIELYPGASDIDALLKEFTPDEHNSKWASENQKLQQNKGDLDKLIKHRRAVAFLYSWKQCLWKHYKENELTLHLMGSSRCRWMINELEQLKNIQNEGQPIWTAKGK